MEDILVSVPFFPPFYFDGSQLLSSDPFSVFAEFLALSGFDGMSLADSNSDDSYDIQGTDLITGEVHTFAGNRAGPLSPAGLAPVIPIPDECGENLDVPTHGPPFGAQGYTGTRAVAVIPGINVGLPLNPTVLAIDCPGPAGLNRIKFLNPRSGSVLKTVTLSGSSNWRSFAYRIGQGDLIGLRSTDDPQSSYTVARIPLSTGSSFTPVDLFSYPQDGVAVGLGWHSVSQRFRVLVDAAVDRIDRFDTSGTFLIEDAVAVDPCKNNYALSPSLGGLAISGDVELAACNSKFGVAHWAGRSSLLDLDLANGASLAFNTQPGVMVNDIECDPETFTNATIGLQKTVVWGVSRTGRVIRAFPVADSKCGFGGAPPTTKLCIAPGGAGADVTHAFAGGASTFARIADGRVLATGNNSSGQLALGNTTNTSVFVESQYEDAVEVAVGSAHSLARFSNGSVAASGSNALGQLGSASVTQTSVPIAVSGISGTVVAIAAGAEFSMALTSDGSVYTWGANDNGQLGDSTPGYRTTPARVSMSASVVAIAAGSSHALALANDGSVWAWGLDSSGQLGRGTSSGGFSAVPQRVVTNSAGTQYLTGVTAISGSPDHNLARLGSGLVATWGSNRYGGLGDGTTSDRAWAGTISKLANVEGIAAGDGFSLAVRTGGHAYSWGRNDAGALGNGTTAHGLEPARVRDRCAPSGYLSGVEMVAVGTAHVIATNRFVSWGANAQGQLGDGTTDPAIVPVSIRLDELPRCDGAYASPAVITSTTGVLTPIAIAGVLDPESQPVTIDMTSVLQDEPQDGTSDPDALITTNAVRVRAEHAASSDGRVYAISFRATDSAGGQCTGTVRVCVHSSGECGDQGPIHLSTAVPGEPELCQTSSEPLNECESCLRDQCCGALVACQAPDACATGAPDRRGEYACMQACIDYGLANGDSLETARDDCSTACATSGGALVSATETLLDCTTFRGTPSTEGACAPECAMMSD
jgi:alpha-tubulin suppressor-like RCC1 family protein